jgi:lysine-N-methylase
MPHFELDPDVRFRCSRCGDCCRTWNVMLGPGEREGLQKLDWTGLRKELIAIEPAQKVSQKGVETRHRLRRRADGSCVYLGDADQCLLHEHFGAAQKPLLCRLYPFGFYPMGDRIGVDVSFACRAVSRGEGEPLTERVPEWTRLLEASSSAATDDRRHRLRADVEVSGALVWELEHFLLGFLADDSLSLFNRVRCAIEFMKIATTGDPMAPTAGPLRQAMAKGLSLQMGQRPAEAKMDKTQRAIFYQWLFLCLNPPPHDLGTWSASRQNEERARRLKAGQRYLKQRGRPWIDDRELTVDFRHIARVDGDIFSRSEVVAPLVSFLKAKVVGQRFLVVGEEELPLVEALPKFLLVLPMTLWTAKALAADRGVQRVEEVDVRQALRRIDRTLGTLPTSALPKKQAEACDFIMLETDLVEAATCDVVRGG